MYYKLNHYKSAAELLKLAKENGTNIKQVLYNERRYKFMNIKSLFALVCETLKHWKDIDYVINESKILTDNPGFNIWHVRILINELIFGKKALHHESTFVNKILEYETLFKQLLSKQNIEISETCKTNLDIKVRYIKVNTIKDSVESVIEVFTEEGWQQIPTAESYTEYLDQLRDLKPRSESFLQDFHIPEVLVFPSGTELHSHHLYKNGMFFFMDKSSCLAPYLLQPKRDSCVLDMCAAPGLKTVHLSGLVQSGKVYAVERDGKRFQSLLDIIGHCGANNVEPINEDVTKLQVDQYAGVEYILLDPSCSGSGMRSRQPLVKDNRGSDDKDRLYRLAGFQISLLRFALTRFPAVKRVVYSTCSINVEENEEVVNAALNSMYHNFKVTLAGKKLSGWTNFGSGDFCFGSKCIYSRPETDLTNGFFVAVFKRRKNQICNELPEFENTNKKQDGVIDDSSIIVKDECTELHTNHNNSGKSYNQLSTYCKNSTTLDSSQGDTVVKPSKRYKRNKDSLVDSFKEFSPPNKIKKVDKLEPTDQVSKSDKSNNTKVLPDKMIEKKKLTKSFKKRIRKINRKKLLLRSCGIKKSKTVNEKEPTTHKETNLNSEKVVKSKHSLKDCQFKSKNNSKDSSGINVVNKKVSKSKLRYLRKSKKDKINIKRT